MPVSSYAQFDPLVRDEPPVFSDDADLEAAGIQHKMSKAVMSEAEAGPYKAEGQAKAGDALPSTLRMKIAKQQPKQARKLPSRKPACVASHALMRSRASRVPWEEGV